MVLVVLVVLVVVLLLVVRFGLPILAVRHEARAHEPVEVVGVGEDVRADLADLHVRNLLGC